jgi:hemolysin activation/secretion protein
MKKLLIAGNLFFALSILGACGSDEAEPEENSSNDTAEMNDQQDTQEMEEPTADLFSSEKLQERIQKGMDLDSYSAELTAMKEKGETTLVKKYNLTGNEEIKAQILQSSDGFVAVETDGLEVTDVSSYKSMKEVEDHLNDKDMEEDMSE